MQPASKIVICEPLSDTSKSGLVMSSDGKDKPEQGKVIAIGKGDLPVKCKVGDVIVFQKYTENIIPIHGKDYNFVKFEHILAVI